ncbi:MAG: N-acetylmuramoyl-L-alanine amidase [Pseudomonadota bacterium]|nr:N-acetylmuramoyl-L-alanine amidase [Pseudomonadota bacterium]MEC8619817.1 N-acetylmuramoyl-L-alanine amidase [Pseudomonadota bacterium]
MRTHEAPDYIRVVLDTSKASKYSIFALENPHRIVIDVKRAKPAEGLLLESSRDLTYIRGLRGGSRDNGYRIVVDADVAFNPKSFTLKPISPYGHRLVADLYFPKGRKKSQPAKSPLTAAVKGGRDIIIAIDPGHGGEDPGALGPRNILEKDVVLQIARRTMNQIKSKKGFDAFLIRHGDYYLGHRQRTALARDKRADLFVSIHADAFRQASVSGASVYTLSDRGATSETAKWLAERENQSDMLGGVGNVSLDDKDPMLAQVLLDLSMDGNRNQSIQVGEAVLRNMGQVTKLHKKRVEQAAFLVLKSPDMPSILVESGFISNPVEARNLATASHQLKLAKAIANGVEEFMRSNPPPATWLAQRREEIRYTIGRGDTISEIAQRYGVTSAALKKRNRLSSDNIREGQTIVIPRG